MQFTRRTYPKSENQFLRFQVGRMELRKMRIPIYGENKMFICECEGSQTTAVFHLLGWGDTMDKAEAMAESKI